MSGTRIALLLIALALPLAGSAPALAAFCHETPDGYRVCCRATLVGMSCCTFDATGTKLSCREHQENENPADSIPELN
jgi:hypothetical protein